jgi:hypothetical protein
LGADYDQSPYTQTGDRGAELAARLVTDAAWGLDYALSGHPDLPEGALSQGSDLAIGSVSID